MPSEEERSTERMSNKATLYMQHLPVSLLNWKTLKTHFSRFGDVVSCNINPQQRTAVITYENEDDARYAMQNGNYWQNKEIKIHQRPESLSGQVDPRASVSMGYGELDVLWDDEDMDYFGVEEKKSQSVEKEEIKQKTLKQKHLLKSSKEEKVMKSSVSVKPLKKASKEEALAFAKKKVSQVSNRTRTRSHEELAFSLKTRLALLEERDKLIRKSFVKTSNVELAKTIVGTCPDMCPEKERMMREYQRLVSVFEMVPGTQKMDPSLAVKAYSRSSADQEEPLPHELRPERVLSMTMAHIITNIMILIEDVDVNISDWYDFCWDRLRGIRKDIIQQQLCDLETVTIIEQCARFHIVCYDRLWGISRRVFDEKINTENLMNCLQSLRHMYEDLAKENVKCPNEDEFNVYMILLNMRTGDLISEYQQFSSELQTKDTIQFAVKVYLAFNNSMYSQFFKLVKQSTYLNACLLQRYFYTVRVQAIQTIVRAYCPPKKCGYIPLQQAMQIFKFDDSEDAKLFCEGHGFILKERDHFEINRNDFFIPETQVKITNPSSLVTLKRTPISEAVTGPGVLFHFKKHKVHSSFTLDGRLKDSAHDASDQKATMDLDDEVDYEIPESPKEDVYEEVLDEVDDNWQEEVYSMEVDDDSNEIDDGSKQEYFEIKPKVEPLSTLKFKMEQPPVSPAVKKTPSPKAINTFEFKYDDVFKSVFNTFSKFQEPVKETIETKPYLLPQASGGYQTFTTQGNFDKSVGSTGFVWGKMDSGLKSMESVKYESVEESKESRDEISDEEEFFEEENEEQVKVPSSPIEKVKDKTCVDLPVEKEEKTKKASPKQKKDQVMRILRADLRRRLKVVTAKHYMRKWKRKVEKMKLKRKDLPHLQCIPIDQHLLVWGCVKKNQPTSVLHRLQEKRRCIETTSTILEEHLCNSVPFLGLQIAESIVFNNSSGTATSFKDFSIPLWWKLAVSVPFTLRNDPFLVEKFNNWTRKLFYGSKRLGSVVQVNATNCESVHYCVNTVTSDDSQKQRKLTGILGLLFICVDGLENTVEKYARLQDLIGENIKNLPVAVIDIGKRSDDLVEILDKNQKLGYISKWQEEYWKDMSSILSSLEFLIKESNLPTEVKANTLSSVLERLTESIFSVMMMQLNFDLAEPSKFLKDPNNLIRFHNLCIDNLESILSHSKHSVESIVPPEFQEYVKPATKRPDEKCPSLCKSSMSEISASLDDIRIPEISNWPPTSNEELVEIMSCYCTSINCQRIFPQVIRMIDLQDDTDIKMQLPNIPWVAIVDIMVRRVIQNDYTKLKSLVVLYNENDLTKLCDIKQCYSKMLRFVRGDYKLSM